MGKWIKTNGEVLDIEPKGETFDLQEMYEYIGCKYVEFVYLIGGIMIVDEEGKLTGKELNRIATRMTRGHLADSDLIVGDVMFVDRKDLN